MKVMKNIRGLFARRAEKVDASIIREICTLVGIEGLISLAGGWPNAEVFPLEFTRRVIDRLVDEGVSDLLQYGMSEGYLPLRKKFTRYLAENESVTAGVDEILIATGAQMGMELTCRLFVEDGDYCLVDLPTYFGGVGSIRFYGGKIVGVPTDDGGTRVDEMEKIVEKIHGGGGRVKLFYLQSSNHNPLGVSLEESRRVRLIELARRHNFIIMEDCPYINLTYDGESPVPLKSIDEDGRVVYIKSFAKIFGPSLRLAAVVASSEVISKMVVFRQFVDCCPSNLSQFILYEFFASGEVEVHLERIKRFYRARRDKMLGLLQEYFPPEVRWTKPSGGLFVFVHLPSGMDASSILDEAMAEKVAFVPGKQFFVDGSGSNTMRLSFAQCEEDKMEVAIKVVGRIIKEKL